MLFGPIFQLGYLTEDIQAAARAWFAAGVGPWTLMRDVTMPTQIDGRRVDIEIDVALSYRGDMQIELIQPRNDVPSPYQRHRQAGLWGLHHLGFMVDDMDSCLKHAAQHNLQHFCTIDQGGGQYCYIHGPAGWFELLKASDDLLGFFDMIKSGCNQPDNQEFIRELQL